MNHTPGPWNVTAYEGRVFVEPTGRPPMGEYICEVGLPTGERVAADARLIAAAPDLLAACERIAEEQRIGLHGAISNEALAQLRAALDRAR